VHLFSEEKTQRSATKSLMSAAEPYKVEHHDLGSNHKMPDVSTSSPSPPPQDDSTNTLILTGLHNDLFQSDFLNPLRKIFASFGEINQWVPLRSMVRIIIVYSYDEDAMRAKASCDELLNDLFDR